LPAAPGIREGGKGLERSPQGEENGPRAKMGVRKRVKARRRIVENWGISTEGWDRWRGKRN